MTFYIQPRLRVGTSEVVNFTFKKRRIFLEIVTNFINLEISLFWIFPLKLGFIHDILSFLGGLFPRQRVCVLEIPGNALVVGFFLRCMSYSHADWVSRLLETAAVQRRFLR